MAHCTMFGDVIGRARPGDGPWEDPYVDDPEMAKHTQGGGGMQFHGESWETGPWILSLKFEPDTKADAHVHDYDTVYYIRKGRFTFNDGSGWYGPGDLRWVRAGTMYGPEEAGPEGAEVLLVANGPITTVFDDGVRSEGPKFERRD